MSVFEACFWIQINNSVFVYLTKFDTSLFNTSLPERYILGYV